MVILSFNVIAVENQRPSLFNGISKFFKSMFEEEKRITDDIDVSENKEIKQVRIIGLERLRNIIKTSDCIQKLPKPAAIKLNIFDEKDNKNTFFMSSPTNINNYSGQKFDLSVDLSLNNLLLMEKSTNMDTILKSLIDSEDLEFDYKFFRVLKYKNVLSCIKNTEIVIEEPQEEEIELEEKVILPEVEPIKITIVNNEELTPKELKYFFDDFENNVPYTIIADDTSDYSNLRAIKLLTNWNYAVESIAYDSIENEEDISNKKLILITYSCDSEISSLTINEEECVNLIEGKKGVISFYEENQRNILAIIGNNGQDLVDSVSILTNYPLFNFNETNEVLTDEEMYILITIPERLNEIRSQVKSIDEEVQIYSESSWRGFNNIRGSWFRAVHKDLARGSIKFSEEQKQILEELDLIKLGLEGDKLVDQRKIVQSAARKVKSAVPSAIYYLKIDKNSVNLQTLEKYESALNSLQISYDNFQKELEKYNELEEELKLPWIKARQIVNAAKGGSSVYIQN